MKLKQPFRLSRGDPNKDVRTAKDTDVERQVSEVIFLRLFDLELLESWQIGLVSTPWWFD